MKYMKQLHDFMYACMNQAAGVTWPGNRIPVKGLKEEEVLVVLKEVLQERDQGCDIQTFI